MTQPGGGGVGIVYHLEQLIAYRGNEEPADAEVQQVVLKSRMVEQLKRKLNTTRLVFPPEHYKDLLFGFAGNPPRRCRRDQILAMTLQKDQSRDFMDCLSSVLPERLSKRNTSKTALSSVLADSFLSCLMS